MIFSYSLLLNRLDNGGALQTVYQNTKINVLLTTKINNVACNYK